MGVRGRRLWSEQGLEQGPEQEGEGKGWGEKKKSTVQLSMVVRLKLLESRSKRIGSLLRSIR